MVYVSTRSGLNSVIWVPSFSLPTIDTLTDMLEPSSWMSDLDMGEQFSNFPLDPALQPYCGIDVRPYLGAPSNTHTLWFRWVHCMMGLKSSLYVTIKGIHLVEEYVFGNHHLPSNPFHWSNVHLNLPGMEHYDPFHWSHVHLNLPNMEHYDPNQPWVSRQREDGIIASGAPRFVDDLRPLGPSEEEFWSATHTLTSCYCYLSLQMSSRKTRPPSQQPGAWAGSHVVIHEGGIGVTCGNDKWVKAQGLLKELQEELQAGSQLSHKSLEQKRGFFVHLQRTYPCIMSFLKGMHLTIDSWRPGRDLEGWKIHHPSPDADMDLEWNTSDSTDAPEFLTAVPWLHDDLDCLLQLFSPKHPPICFVCSTKIVSVTYGFGNASGEGFGSSFCLPNGTLIFRHGTWGRDPDCTSSNFRELFNLVQALEDGV
jgi:hypothetical protein